MSSILSSVEKIAEPIGKDIGRSNDEVQAALLNGFCYGLSSTCPTESRRHMQHAYIVDKLTPNACKVLTELVGFIEHRKAHCSDTA